MTPTLNNNAIAVKNIGATTKLLSEEEAPANLNNPDMSLEKKDCEFINETCSDIYIKESSGFIMRIRSCELASPSKNFVISYKITSTKKSLLITKDSMLRSGAPEHMLSAVCGALDSMDKEGIDESNYSVTKEYTYNHVIDTSSFTDKSVHYDSMLNCLISFNIDKLRSIGTTVN